jgi:hypothetical protein
MSRVVRTSSLLAALALLALTVGGASAGASPQAHAARKCSIPGNGQQSGGIYFTSLSVKRTSCGTGRAVEKAFQKCRKGPRGHCHHRVKGFACKEHRAGIQVQFDSSVSCKRGSKRVHFTYTQNT